MPSIADIPCELVSSILRSLDDFETLTSALLACRHIYTSFKQIAGTELAILRRKIGLDLLPYAVASLEASRLKPSPGDDSSIRALLDLLYDNPSQLVARTASISSEFLRSMSRKHDWVTTLALSYAAEARIHLSSDIAASPEAVDLSPSEYIRFCRAFYRVDLFYLLFGAVGNFNGLSGMGNLLFHRHPPWVNEQLGCVHDFIEDKFLEDLSASELATIIPVCENVCNTDKGLTRVAKDTPITIFSQASSGMLNSMSQVLMVYQLAVKDNIATEGLPTTCSSAILSSHESPYEATIVRQLRKRGAQVVGKTNMDEFGMGSHSLNSIHGPVLNSLSATPTSAGGSSGGSAVAVQTSEADVALGTDTGGSIRLPAAYCGVVGYKPSYGMLSRFGVVPYANSLDTVGLLARDVDVIEDLMFSTGLDAEHDSQDPTSLSKSFRKKQQSQAATGRSRLRIGIPLEYNIEELDPKIKAAWSDAADLLQKSGIEVVPVSLPSTKHALSAYYVIAPAEASSNLAKYDGVRYGTRGDESDGAGEVLYSKTRGLGFGEEVRRRILLGAYSLSSEAMDNYFIQAQRVRKLVQRDFDRVFRLENPLYDEQQFDLSDMKDEVELQDKLGPSQVDFLLCPTAPTFAPRIEDIKRQTPVQVYMNDVFTVPASLAGLPAISIPAKIKSEDEEVDGSRRVAGLQLIGQYWDDKRLLSVAKNLLSQLLA
ncbi:hypothetical protein CTAM01_13458 [Colletotrichum tamarilloi]|uniref:Glutamyl-tRNA(Gln) amidotransferase subunit A, mitochondrial n=1 Tax=Colletotrichum tamarilloi TaxID=1209934 RepID=A0ABQ9QS78_9PEZI|nr:uncharacterized protein CTAM01_13458 [Colletotrichum tamarilloi]KAK1483381.1 hypothetical protein CTAM01_13458 [Colletotrichum tamarilloi]